MLPAENALELTKINKNNNMNNGIVERTPLSVLYTDIYKSRGFFFFQCYNTKCYMWHQELQDK